MLSRPFTTTFTHTHTHTEKMDMLLAEVKVLDRLPASQTLNKFSLCTVSVYVCVCVCTYLSARVCACALSAALAKAVIIIVMSRSLQVIFRYSTQREKESRQLIEDISQWTGVSALVCTTDGSGSCENRVNCMWIFWYCRFFFPLRFLSAEMHTLVMGMGSMCVYVCVCACCKVFFLCAAFFSACVCMWVNDCAIIAVVVVEEWWLTD